MECCKQIGVIFFASLAKNWTYSIAGKGNAITIMWRDCNIIDIVFKDGALSIGYRITMELYFSVVV